MSGSKIILWSGLRSYVPYSLITSYKKVPFLCDEYLINSLLKREMNAFISNKMQEIKLCEPPELSVNCVYIY